MPRQIITTADAPIRAGGASLDDVVEVGILLTGQPPGYGRWFANEPPTRYVAKLGVDIAGLLVSVRMSAVLP